jgi:hypothetical protein
LLSSSRGHFSGLCGPWSAAMANLRTRVA